MDKETLQQFEARCIQDEPPACQSMCPVHFEARAFIKLMAAGKIDEARKVLDRGLPLSGLSAFLCEGPCREHCRRAEIDQGLDLPLLERFCAANGRMPKIMPMPPGNKKAAVIGAGLAGLIIAWELARKGFGVKIFHVGPAGGRLNNLDGNRLPPEALPEALKQLASMRVVFEKADSYSPEILAQARAFGLAVFLSFDDPTLTPGDLGLSPAEAEAEPVALATGLENVFARPLPDGEPRFIDDLAAGKKGAGSIIRVGQGVPPSSARETESTYPTKLFTNLEGLEVKNKVEAADPFNPSPAEVQAEADRCIQCQCLECVKHCVYLQHYQGYPKMLARETYNNIATAFGIRTSNTMILSCAECGLCGQVCPGGANMADFIPLARREMVAVNHMPVSAHEFALEDLLYSNSPEISFWRHQPGKNESGWMFFPGCQLPAARPDGVTDSYIHLQKHLPEGVGFMMGCCGAPARWSGRPGLTAEVVQQISKAWEEAGQPQFILACPSCALFFKAELPQIKTVSLWKILSELPLPAASGLGSALALHDPCAARNDGDVLSAVRRILKGVNQPVEEMKSCGQTAKCCGYGGLADEANREVGEKFAADLAADAGRAVISYCIMCRDRLKQAGQPSLHLLDLLFPGEAPELAAEKAALTISGRQEGRAAFSRKILKQLWNQSPTEDQPMRDDIVLNISPEVEAQMDRRRILKSDVKAVLSAAGPSGAQFVNPESGRSLTSLRPKQVTFWVEYSQNEDGSFTIHDAYCHRMVVPGVPGRGESTAASREGFDPSGGRR
ncbi:4Fe-4S dicluster domain-containing protein [Deltaproteobacteria bacterium OttesenSCG-928-K17]|nr:4Fe-4S dicluster domain-containing protein [Deltaproteobacteria bacterium OttesenSCG-928-K17]